MGNPKAFLNISRKEGGYRPKEERVKDYNEVEMRLNAVERCEQASRCMECGVPFCHWSCPLGNRQPEWQDRLYMDDIEGAYALLSMSDDFPEFTGRVCPALCEKGCVLNKQHEAVTVRENELAIVERAFAEGRVKPQPPTQRTGKRVAVIGSGPAGLACANQLNRRGHSVTVFEKNEAPGGLLRFGIPDFKLDKSVIDRRVALMEAEGVEFRCGVNVGRDIKATQLLEDYDAVCLAIGAEEPRDLRVEGRELKGVHFALELLRQQNRVNAGRKFTEKERVTAKGKNVLVIGGGDTGSDCVGTSHRQGAISVTQIEIMPKPPVDDNPDTPWPYWPVVLKTSSSHEEGCDRRWLLDTRRFIPDDKGCVSEVEVEEVEWEKDSSNGRMNLVHTGRKSTIKAELVLLAMGFTNPLAEGLLDQLGVEKDARGNVKVDPLTHATDVDKVFAAGDVASGASLVVRCIAAGRDAAKGIHAYLSTAN
ncbi:glutamate synthase subunit beta [Duncaniella muricolitica]|jgi:glutamate synthase (NADPH/NADH) small chain|uniref:glutamate synthase subunit beta n=1 Tax=Duncaniella muricolitica TaxID=2880704 RepID=UPI00244DA3B6|nr:glutamate synthase subunit beta [Duncaniella muricolitica]